MRKSVLILGADAGLGAGVYAQLRKSYDTYTYQENPANLNESDPTWFMGDLSEPQESVVLITKLLETLRGKKLSAMVVVSRYGMRLYEGVMSWDLARAAIVNVFEPLILLKFLLKYDVMDWSGRAVFMLDKFNSGVSHFPLKVVGVGMENMVRAFSESLPATFQVGFVSCVGEDKTAAATAAGLAVDRMLEQSRMVSVEV